MKEDKNRRFEERDGKFHIQSLVDGEWVDETRVLYGRVVVMEDGHSRQEPDSIEPRVFPDLQQAKNFLQREALKY